RIPIAMAAAALRSRRSGTVGRESRSGRGESEIGPATGHQALQRREAVLVGHLRALGDPIAEVDERPPAVPAFFAEPENAPGPEAAFRLIRRIKAVGGRDAVVEEVDQRRCDETSIAVTELQDFGAHRSVFDHSAVIAPAHRCHVAVDVARALIGRKQPELFNSGAGRNEAAAKIAIYVADAPRRAGMAEAVDGDPHRNAGSATAAGRAVGEAVAAPEPGAR